MHRQPSGRTTNLPGVSDSTEAVEAAIPGEAIAEEPAVRPEATPSGWSRPEPDAGSAVDLDAIERDLDDVQTALGRLNDGTYWTDEVTGEKIPDHVLAANPTMRRA